jgi:hypothetical protein
MPAAEAQALSHTRGVKSVVPDATVIIGEGGKYNTKTVAASQVRKPAIPARAADGQQLCNTNPSKPLVEPEALTSIHATQASATGRGVIIGNVDAASLAGNVNMIRPNGQHVIIDAPNPNENVCPSRTSPRTAASASWVTPPAPLSSPLVSSPTATTGVRSWLRSRRSSPGSSRR